MDMIKNRRIPRGPLCLIVGFVLLAVAVTGAWYGQFDYSELCPVCARARHVAEWQVPGTQRVWYSVREEKDTPLSRVLVAHQLVEAHEHPWQFVRGHGNGRTVVLGLGHPVSWSLQSPNMGAFMETMLKLTDRDTASRWLNHLRDPRYSRLCQAMADASTRRTFNTREEWELWLFDFEREHRQMIAQPGRPQRRP
jgi:hypothetical protein